MNGNQLTTCIALFIYKRPHLVRQVCAAINKHSTDLPVIIIADGPRDGERDLVKQSLSIAKDQLGDRIHRIYAAPNNMGCKKRFFSGLDAVFSEFNSAIIIEDDCIPEQDFFSFCLWGLHNFMSDKNVSQISGCNFGPKLKNIRNGFSAMMNCWGWATWKDRWSDVNQDMTIFCPRTTINSNTSAKLLSYEKLFWIQVLKHAVISTSIWDFYFQEMMFRLNRYSVYPQYSLIKNVGFGPDATHTKMSPPHYVRSNDTNDSSGLMDEQCSYDIISLPERDRYVAKTIWNCKPYQAIKLCATHSLRYMLA